MSANAAISNTDVMNFDMVRKAISLLVDSRDGPRTEGTSEDYVGRYVNNFLRQIFTVRDWSIVPQYFSRSGDFPDLVLETWTEKIDGTTVFVPKIFIELKSSTGDTIIKAMEQLKMAVAQEFGKNYRNKGYLIVVRGDEWLFMEYQFVLDTPQHNTRTRLSRDVVLQTWPLDFPGLSHPEGKPRRPTQLPPDARFDGYGHELSVKNKNEFNYIKNLLFWLSYTKGKCSRDLHKEQGLENLPSEISESVLASGETRMNLMRNMSDVWNSDELDDEARRLCSELKQVFQDVQAAITF